MESDEELCRASQEVEAELDINNFVEMVENEGDRFFVSNEDDLANRAEYSIPENTRRRDKWASNVFTSWAVARNNRQDDTEKILKNLESLTDEELAKFMPVFVIEVRKQNGEEYPPNTIFQIVMGIQSFLKSKAKRDVKFLQKDVFQHFRQVLDGEMKRLTHKGLTHKGLGVTKKQAEVISENDEELLWKTGQLGNRNPRTLLNTILYLNGKNFSLRSGQEHRKLRFLNSQITLKTSDSKEFLNYHEDYSKTVQGGIKHRKLTPKDVNHFPGSNPERCHVRLYKQYISLCPPDGHDDAFYLQVLRSPTEKCWYSRQPLGHNTLQKIIPEMCRKAGIKGYKTNHSLRATTATRLYAAGVSEQLIMERTGHRIVTGIRSYTRTSVDQQQHVSDILNQEGNEAVKEEPAQPRTPRSADTTPPALHFENCVFNFK